LIHGGIFYSAAGSDLGFELAPNEWPKGQGARRVVDAMVVEDAMSKMPLGLGMMQFYQGGHNHNQKFPGGQKRPIHQKISSNTKF